MNEISSGQNGTRGHGSYFFLSYAHFHPLAGKLIEDLADPSDEWVRTFFRDLTDAVRLIASPPLPAPGFFDQEIPADPDWKAVLSAALGTAEVFVPLFSPDYITKSWPGREWVVFEHRMKSAGISDPLLRFVPVLWTPLPADQRPRGLQEALGLAPAPAALAYAENGLRALLRIRPYHHLYQMIVKELAKRIVELAEKTPVGPSAAQDIDKVDSTLGPGASAAAFAIVVAAPAAHDVPAGAECSAYGPARRAWRPFGRDHQLPLAECAQVIAERLDFAAEVLDIETSGGAFIGKPGVVLIDPWYLIGEERLNAFRMFARRLPPWALPVIVPDPSAAQLTQQARISLEQSIISGSEPARRGLQGVRSLREFVNLMPFLVAQAERDYLRHGPIQRSAAPTGSRPRLAHHGQPTWPISSQSQQENPAMENSAEGPPSA